VSGVSVDPSGNIYVLDAFNYRIMKWAPGAAAGSIVAGGNGNGSNSNQIGLAAAFFLDVNTLTIWIADTMNNRIVKWSNSSNGVIVCGSFGIGADQFNSPGGLFVDSAASNTLYVADTLNSRIQKWLPGATSGITVAGVLGSVGNGLNQFLTPATLIVDTSGIMFILDFENLRIMKWIQGSSAGTVIASSPTVDGLPSQWGQVTSMAIDSSGSLYVADSTKNHVLMYAVSCRKCHLGIRSAVTALKIM
jgi:sugar lactone lactonase YvrE